MSASTRSSASVFGRRFPGERGPVPARTFSHDIGSPINALSRNRDGSVVVVAGRTVFKTLNLREDKFEELLNLRVGRMNLTFSSTDVQWHPTDRQLIATAATNGAVVLWNLGKKSRSKQMLVYNDHKRTANKVTFPPDGSFLLSGSQDGTVKLFDNRSNTKECQTTFSCGSESVRDVQINSLQQNVFAAAFEGGTVQLWDVRTPKFQVKGLPCHNGPVFSCHWHPEERNWLATAGRDKMIKVWDLQESPIRGLYSIQTIASVARIKWRPKKKFHIGSCAFLVENSLNVWDVRRTFVPFATFTEHKDVTTSFDWMNEKVLLSGSKDNMLMQHAFKDAERPANDLPPVGMTLNIRGDITHASCETLMIQPSAKSILSPTGVVGGVVRVGAAFFKRQERPQVDTFLDAKSLVVQFKCPPKIFDFTEEVFRHLAKSYWVDGHSFEEICDHNAASAMEIQRVYLAKTWTILKHLYAPEKSSKGASIRPDDTTSVSGNFSAQESKALDRRSSVDGMSKRTAENATASTDFSAEDETESTSESDGVTELQNIASGADFRPNDEDDLDSELGSTSFRSGAAAAGRGSVQNWGQLPSEAFEPRHELQSGSSSDSDSKDGETAEVFRQGNAAAHPTGGTDSQIAAAAAAAELIPSIKEPATLKPFVFKTRLRWDYTPVVIKMLHYFANQGDVQMSVTMILALGDKLNKGSVEETTLEQWFLSYIELLQQFQLCSTAALVIKVCPLESVNGLNLESTMIPSNCNKCRKPLGKAGWFCDRCLLLTNSCSFCHETVKGLYVWCQGCGHGGHLAHMSDWFAASSLCPTGCGHRCEYS